MKRKNALVAAGALGVALAGGAVVSGLTIESTSSPKPAARVAATGSVAAAGGQAAGGQAGGQAAGGQAAGGQAAATAIKKTDYGPWNGHFANQSLKCRTYASAGTVGGRVWHYGKIECNKKTAIIDVVSGVNPGKPAIAQHLCRDVKSCTVKGWVNNPSGNQNWSVTTTGSAGVLLFSGERLSAHVTFRA
ncbi:hypothetical protein BKA00_006361 [Actinomadura coerulea]|uniref:Uncharacterized protein n=1 Tax=Actinomadura coerulea TaxID=46159 RepID=A0A7X0G4Y4_9ACTN|nr:hypothetical protein [Actinomadura coerulea]MBB6399447.1 hypothetical protein [Actinomadura coerulea]